ncbi:hypothetical protein AJ79_05572 [Helicocarpus griseus UAMH5409]|uniref:Uncharacterized protein n=1 Tax=Helicocarpus griseus UAMH5409 TaxID=1447875 RepID=A0A2B7XLC0_9EURO|nr:hypothetical protein AJ79_05572 [Helicocarpus griseus UAMH5409]
MSPLKRSWLDNFVDERTGVGYSGRLPTEEHDEVICVKEHHVETSNEHFPRGADVIRPMPSAWRNNLTALSQHRNLYFVASGHQIYIYQPSGRGRALASIPAMVMTPAVKHSRARGYIRPQNPHIINCILVDDLGHEEILVIATDGGNVTAYRTERIYAVIQEALANGNNKPTVVSELVECFFSDWVGQSAWGLAVHKAARLIAVSSNSWCITVFAFALVDPASVTKKSGKEQDPTTSFGDTLEWTNVSLEKQYQVLRQLKPEQRRMHNIRFNLVGHKTNIPNIAFLNSDMDPDGDWLLSTDINNKLLIFNIWDYSTPVTVIDIQQDPPNHAGRAYDNRQLGWNVLALDPRSFRPKTTLKEACGGTPRKAHDNEDVHDLSSLAWHMHYKFPSRLRQEATEVEQEDDSSDETFSMGSDFDMDSRPGSPTGNGKLSFDSSSSPPLTSRQGEEPDGSCTRARPKPTTEEEKDEETERLARSGSREFGRISNSIPSPPTQTAVDVPSDSMYATVASMLSGPTIDSELVDDLLLSAINTTEDMPNEQSNDSDGSDADDDYADDSEEDEEEEEEEEGDDEEEEEEEEEGEGEEDEEEEDEDEGDAEDRIEYEGEADSYEHAAFDFGGSNADNSLRQSLMQHSQSGDTLDELFPDISNWLSGAEPVISKPPIFADFPILHFSETAVRMLPHPFAKKSSAIFRDPLMQDLSTTVPNLRMTDRFNMVRQIPELGIVLAASQKGRVAIFSLTESPCGATFRLDGIVPTESQEERGIRPLVPLVGMAVGPVENHLIPLDEPSPPSPSSSSSSSSESSPDHQRRPRNFGIQVVHNHNYDHPSKAQDSSPSKHSGKSHFHHHSHPHTRPVPQQLNCDGDPPHRREEWHGIEFSRRYRLLLMYSNLTVMHYELFYEWPADMMSPHGRLMAQGGKGFLLRT